MSKISKNLWIASGIGAVAILAFLAVRKFLNSTPTDPNDDFRLFPETEDEPQHGVEYFNQL